MAEDGANNRTKGWRQMGDEEVLAEVRSRCGFLWCPAWAQTLGYENVDKPDGVSMDHALIMARIRILGEAALRCTKVGTRRPSRLES